jgi:hypothetical protein
MPARSIIQCASSSGNEQEDCHPGLPPFASVRQPLLEEGGGGGQLGGEWMVAGGSLIPLLPVEAHPCK